ncbi:MAG: hypothetical protein RLZZ196_39 [Bacteroidota bacterium]|jgi:hypothetical protein
MALTRVRPSRLEDVFIAKRPEHVADYNGTNVPISTLALNPTTTYGNGLYVMTSAGTRIYTSTDGVSWTVVENNLPIKQFYKAGPTLQADYITDIRYNNGIWVAITRFGLLFTSPDLVTWTERTLGTFLGRAQGNLAQVTYGNSTWVVVGSDVGSANAHYAARSTDNGVTWTKVDLGFSTTNANAVSFGNGLFVAVSNNGLLSTSTDGQTWTARTSGFAATAIYDVKYANGRWVAVGASKQGFSTDGITWGQYGTVAAVNTNNLVWNGTRFVATVANSAAIYTTDGTTQFNLVTTTGTIGTTPNVTAHTQTFISSNGSGTLVKMNTAGAINLSTDSTATAWTQSLLQPLAAITEVVMGTNSFYRMAVDGAGVLHKIWNPSALNGTPVYARSFDDGLTWKIAPGPLTVNMTNISDDYMFIKTVNNILFIGTRAGRLYYSTDSGATWVLSFNLASTTYNVLDIDYGINYGTGLPTYVVVTNVTNDANMVRFSSDLTNWTGVIASATIIPRNIAYGANKWVIASSTGTALTAGLGFSGRDADISLAASWANVNIFTTLGGPALVRWLEPVKRFAYVLGTDAAATTFSWYWSIDATNWTNVTTGPSGLTAAVQQIYWIGAEKNAVYMIAMSGTTVYLLAYNFFTGSMTTLLTYTRKVGLPVSVAITANNWILQEIATNYALGYYRTPLVSRILAGTI